MRTVRTFLTAAAGAVLLAGFVGTAPASADPFTDARARLDGAVAAAGGSPVVYQFGPDFRLPMQRADGSVYDMGTDSRLIVIPGASRSPLTSELLVDRKAGDSLRCEATPTAVAGGIQQTSELYPPVDAWNRMGQPAIAINTNFFDVRPQSEGTSWARSGCSSPLGTYYDTHLATRSLDFSKFWDRYFVGSEGLSDGAGQVWSPLSTFFVVDDNVAGLPMPVSFELHDAEGPFSNEETRRRVDQLELGGREFTAFAGIKLRGPAGEFQFVDNPIRRAARTAIGYNTARDQLYILQGGSNEPDGFTLGNVQDLYRALGADLAVGLDGGGSSALVVNKAAGIPWAGQGINAGIAPLGSCPEAPDAYCSPGPKRPVPGWLGVDMREQLGS
ncbi:phosphodiester glycosidase family protein [Rhodococcus sp. AG1013]|uniref:phosphodiester glycosidase family protein n=1 Tax=unclassified Rhodococcus (in: high G+C Gram-positive bacteria) TaxID=192944 RepID=UPI000E2A50A3|nr:phosphodiester glycosidase family protein [Rhodococcus sp. AG1013]RDI16285.1 uncharacterized protein DUF2233 [Rhodococcus sp. AG1013]